ncbi:MAG: RNA polymerase sigma factor [Leptospirales bacterium]|nr:RNA polymerase sigma factor [Leptospirales bacterium]
MSWLISAGRFKAIDAIRRRARFDASLATMAAQLDQPAAEAGTDDTSIADDRLRLVFTCCHPALTDEARVALTLREVCGLMTEEIARAFLTNVATLAQRIVRAKAKIREAKIPFEIPPEEDLAERLDAVLKVIYLVFNEGYHASSGDALTRPDLSAEAIRLGRLVLDLISEEPNADTLTAHRGEAMGLLALMLLTESRRPARTSPEGDIVLLEEQDRSLWNHSLIDEGFQLIELAVASKRVGPYVLQAMIAAVHSEAPDAALTDWRKIVALYEELLSLAPSPVIELNRAVAIAMRDGMGVGGPLIDVILERGDLVDYPAAHTARAELSRRAGDISSARVSYERALSLVHQVPEKRFLENRLKNLG